MYFCIRVPLAIVDPLVLALRVSELNIHRAARPTPVPPTLRPPAQPPHHWPAMVAQLGSAAHTRYGNTAVYDMPVTLNTARSFQAKVTGKAGALSTTFQIAAFAVPTVASINDGSIV